MKKIVLSVCTIVVMSSFSFAGGNGKQVSLPVPLPIPLLVENSSFYVGLGLVYNRTYSTDSAWFDAGKSTQDETGGFSGIVGYEFNENIAVEGRISQSFFKESYADVLTYSIFLKPQYPLTEKFTVYGLLGFGVVNVEGTNGNSPAHADVIGEEIMNDSSFQWGFGASYLMTEHFSIFADYTSLMNDADISSTLYGYDDTIYTELSTDGLTVGVTYQF